MLLQSKNIVLGVTGSIAAYKSCSIIRRLIKEGANVECILTKSGAEFITPLTLQTLSKNRVYDRVFDRNYKFEIAHISLSKKADVILVAPATADSIAKLALGRAEDLLSSVILASKAKIIICPAMNTNMYKHPAVQKNISTLQSFGYTIVSSEDGELACGDKGDGRLASIDTIVSTTIKCLS
ncbi:MAG: phosphopantothenoylcysteine decarboxylase [Elusimicrobiota bacterium]|jgi:phosphopantothenoylcysteine decarboxylase/phosphopantothenate--cysteine ligase|nr:phosphopantothenoylcysteine decarboxylase [Elusimicrobiota bacterium]